MIATPIPRDIPLPLPANPYFLEVLLVLAFLAHIIFVNLMVGGSILVLGFEIRGLRVRDYDKLARMLAATVTVNKSLAVVLGVAPLLLINVLYTVHFYTANALTGAAWIMVIPTVALTFLLIYLHKYSWDRLRELEVVHIAILALAVLLLLMIPLIFLANVNLMLLPDQWTEVHGFLSTLALPNVFPRYFHFLSASLILTSLYGVHLVRGPKFEEYGPFETLTRGRIIRSFYAIAFVVSLAQFLIGPLVLLTLPAQATHASVVLTVLLGASLAVPAVWMMWKELSSREPSGARLPFIVACLSLTVLCMGLGRHFARATALDDHRRAMAEETERYLAEAEQAAYDQEMGISRAASGVSEGEHLFKMNCSGCHALDRRVVGPPLTEIAGIYGGDPQGIVTWATAPGKKRADMPQMPPFASLGDDKLALIADYILEIGDEG
ncbi:cytochrome c [Pseudenhygromyxa sp. WMMC2535]|uniref:c-type cytochrome n=1 Tax=Pseudenhygromyxa sp. WMMC2535 TaxID=2712867 RepID=UPI0015538704|nr:cytochrome c [Pseudenhygromyxa sp. WMMC2535]NVB42780.1 cytochrome c [Pseudenhygromyxa sp. WMMC2535]